MRWYRCADRDGKCLPKSAINPKWKPNGREMSRTEESIMASTRAEFHLAIQKPSPDSIIIVHKSAARKFPPQLKTLASDPIEKLLYSISDRKIDSQSASEKEPIVNGHSSDDAWCHCPCLRARRRRKVSLLLLSKRRWTCNFFLLDVRLFSFGFSLERCDYAWGDALHSLAQV